MPFLSKRDMYAYLVQERVWPIPSNSLSERWDYRGFYFITTGYIFCPVASLFLKKKQNKTKKYLIPMNLC